MRWLGQFLASGGGDPEVRAWAHFLRGFLAVLKADPAAARPELHAAVAAARQTGQRDLLSEALSMASVTEAIAGDRVSARRLLDEAQAVIADLDYLHGALAVLQARVFHGFFDADLAAVRAAASDGARLAREIGDLYILEVMLLNLGSAALLARDLEEAQRLFTEALRLAHRIDDRVAQFYLLAAFGCHAALSGRAERAANLLGAAETMRTQVGANIMPFLAAQLAEAQQSAAAALGPARFEAEFAAGRSLERDAAIHLALGTTPDADSQETAASPLANREAEVANLIAEGLTNKQIAARLFISERTVDSHVRSILTKLGFRTRTQIATWAATSER